MDEGVEKYSNMKLYDGSTRPGDWRVFLDNEWLVRQCPTLLDMVFLICYWLLLRVTPDTLSMHCLWSFYCTLL